MSINFGTDNAGRYFTCPDHDDFTLSGNHTWLMVIAPYTANSTNPKYFLSTGAFETANSANLYVTSVQGTFAYALNGPNIQTTALMPNLEFSLCYARRITPAITCGEINLTTFNVQQSLTKNDGTISNGGTLYVGARSDLNTARFAQGYISWLALLNVGLSDTDLLALANGTKTLVENFDANIVELWDMSTNAATITGLYKNHVLTRAGTGFGADGSDPLPYQTTATPISFSGPIGDQTGAQDSVFSLDVSPFFSGNQTPFSYSVQAGTLPAGLTLSGSTISGTPTTVETQSGIIIRGTDANLATADSNAFSIQINAAATVVKGINIVLNSRASLTPIASLAGIKARYWDSPTATGAPLLETSTASLTAGGVLELNVDAVTSLPVGGDGYLSLYKEGATPPQDLHFAGRVPIVDIGS